MKQLKFSYELSQSYFNLSKTVSGVFLNPKLSVLYDLPPFLVLLWSPLALSHCSENARYFSCNICNTYILSSSVKALIVFSPGLISMLMSSAALLNGNPMQYLEQLVLQTARVTRCLPANTVSVHVFIWHTHLIINIFYFIIQYLIICTEITNTTPNFEVCPSSPCSIYCHCNIFPLFFLFSLD